MTDRPCLPPVILARASAILHAKVDRVERMRGGYTPQPLRRLHLSNGTSAVLKAAAPDVDSGPHPWGEALKTEIDTYRRFPMLAHWQPRVLSDFVQDGWVVLLMEDLSEARTVPPWAPDAIGIVARDLARMHVVTTGQPRPALPYLPFPPPLLRDVRKRGRHLGGLPGAWDRPAAWKWLDAACQAGDVAMAAGWHDGPHGVIHGDVRSDNLFLRDGHLVLIDWSEVMWASLAREGVYWALGVEVEGGGSAPTIYDRYLAYAPPIPLAATRAALARFTGVLLDRLQAESVPPHIADYYRSMLLPTLSWFASALGLREPPAW